MSGTIILRGAGQLMSLIGLVVLLTAWYPAYSFAQVSNKEILEKLEQLQQRIERLERNLERKQEEPKQTGLSPKVLPGSERKQEEAKEIGTSSLREPSQKSTVHEQLLQEELGRVQGIITWQGKPLVNGKVRIELERYTGVSWASVKKMFSGKEKESYESDQGVFWSTQTDSKGQYAFEKVPPGTYRLYWWPDFKTGWVHRLREKPDFEVVSGKLTIQNIPERPSIMKASDKKL